MSLSRSAGALRFEAQHYIALACLCWYLAVTSLAAVHVAFPNNYDELAHLSYATQLSVMGMPKIGAASMLLLDPTLSGHFSSQPNYLNHPPAYYYGLGFFLPASGWPTGQTVLVLRALNVLLSVLAVGCALAIGLLRRLEVPLFALYGAMIVMVPVLPYLGGAINNDNLAILGGCVCLLGAQLLQDSCVSSRGWILITLGCVISALAKLTATIMTFGFSLAFIALRWRAMRQRPDMRFLILFLASEAVACGFYVSFMLRYGTPAPQSASFEEVYRNVAVLRPHLHGWIPGQDLSFPAYLAQFAVWLMANWNPVTSMRGMAAIGILIAPIVALILALPAIVANQPARRQADSLIAAGGIALAITAMLHAAFSYHMFRLTGSPPLDAVPRYYFPLSLILLPLATCWTLSRMPGVVRLIGGCALALGLVIATPLIAVCGAGACL